MKRTWILVANSASATIYQALNNQSLEKIENFSHPESRLHVSDLVSDQQGRSFESSSTTRHAVEQKTSPKETEFLNFAKDLSANLNSAHQEGKFDKLYVVASPHFLGLLRESMSSTVISTLTGEIAKDITQHDAKQIRNQLPEVL